jgi:hypothetical protein
MTLGKRQSENRESLERGENRRLEPEISTDGRGVG